MNWNRTLMSGMPSNCYHHSQLDSVNSNIFHQLSTTPHNYEGYLPSAPLQASNDVFDSDMSELCNIILSDSFCNGNSNGNSNSSNGEEFQQQRNCLTTTDVSTTSTCTQYSQENFMALNSFVSASADSLPDTGAGFNSNYRHDCYDDYYRPDCYAEASCHSTLATATEQHSPPSYSSSPQCSAAGADPTTTSAFVSPRELQEVFDDLTRRPTDPIGKFLKEQQLSASEAIALDIQRQLLLAPKKQRTKYGKRTHLSEEQRLALSRQRNREHARATRLRKKIFKQITEVRRRDGHTYTSNTSSMDTDFHSSTDDNTHLNHYHYHHNDHHNHYNIDCKMD